MENISKPDDLGKIKIIDHLIIRDKETDQVLVSQREKTMVSNNGLVSSNESSR